ncbi:MAG TPA: dihydrodipicolinate synthase family protein [Puia sp.]|nr:dihydrodipicolinate synthase family protein [Puia sp.]
MHNSEKKFVPVMITPYNLKAKVDMDVVRVLIDFYLAAGVKGFFANCLSSEMYSLSEDERLELTAGIVRYVRGRAPVVATGSFGLTIGDKALFTRRIFDTGVDAVVLITGHYANIEDGDDVLLRNFDKMLGLTPGVPLGMYECPAPYKRVLSPDVFGKLIASGRFVYYKDTSIDRENVQGKIALADRTKGFEFYDAHTPHAMYSLRAGAKGMSSIAGNFYPEVLVWMCDNATNPDRQEDVAWLQSELSGVDPLIHIAYPMSAKYFLRKRGLPVRTISRAHVLELSPEQKRTLDDVHERYVGWMQRLGIKAVDMEQAPSSYERLDPAI